MRCVGIGSIFHISSMALRILFLAMDYKRCRKTEQLKCSYSYKWHVSIQKKNFWNLIRSKENICLWETAHMYRTIESSFLCFIAAAKSFAITKWFLSPLFLKKLCRTSPAVFLGLCSTNQSWLAHGIAELERQYQVTGRKEISFLS